MNQNRSWPGVPNRYSTRCLPMVIRPKSIATVVVVLPLTPLRSSCSKLALVKASSVYSGRTSLIAPTSVVLPAPNPPATRILNTARGPSVPSEGAETMQHLPEQLGTGQLTDGLVRQHGDLPHHDEVGKQDADHAQRQRGVGRQVGHGDRIPAQAKDLAVLRAERHRVSRARRLARGDDDRDQVQHLTVGWLGPAAGQRVGTHDRAGVPGIPLVARAHGGLTPPLAGWLEILGWPPGAGQRA